jgi:hypothetical protein
MNNVVSIFEPALTGCRAKKVTLGVATNGGMEKLVFRSLADMSGGAFESCT